MKGGSVAGGADCPKCMAIITKPKAAHSRKGGNRFCGQSALTAPHRWLRLGLFMSFWMRSLCAFSELVQNPPCRAK